jgi:tetratricopeptide (TPR) repeat protein
MNTILWKEIKALQQQDKDDELEKLLESYLRDMPHETELWLRLAIVEIYPPFADYDKAVYCLSSILSYDSDNINALLLLAYVSDMFLGGIDDELFKKLNKVSLKEKVCQSMVELAKAWYYERRNKQLYEASLLKSIQLSPSCVFNYVNLARYYAKTGKIEEAKTLFRKALANVTTLYTSGKHQDDPTNKEEFFKVHIKGTSITDILFQSMKKELERLEKIGKNQKILASNGKKEEYWPTLWSWAQQLIGRESQRDRKS